MGSGVRGGGRAGYDAKSPAFEHRHGRPKPRHKPWAGRRRELDERFLAFARRDQAVSGRRYLDLARFYALKVFGIQFILNRLVHSVLCSWLGQWQDLPKTLYFK
jgi:hypothetical protein